MTDKIVIHDGVLVARAIKRVYRLEERLTAEERKACRYREIRQNTEGRDQVWAVYPINTLFYGEQAKALLDAGLAVEVIRAQPPGAVVVVEPKEQS